MNSKQHYSKIKTFLLCLLFAFISFGITCYSSTLLRVTSCPHQDSYAYRYIGMLIAKGGMPYLDAFDNKGPVLYIINWLGYLISKSFGVYLFELLFIFLFFLFQYRIALLFSKGAGAVVFTIASASALSVFYVGNMTEEYALPFLSLGLYAFVSYFLFNKMSRADIYLCGLGFACVFMLRPNMIMLWVVFCIYVIVHELIKNKKFPIGFTVIFLAGAMSVLIPIMIWLQAGGAALDFFKDYFLANFIYCGNRFSLRMFAGSYFHFLISSFMEVHLVLLLILIIRNKDRVFNIVYFIYMVLNLGFVCMAGICFDNYAMILVPSFIYPICAFWKYFESEDKFIKKKIYPLLWAVSSILLFVFICKNIIVCTGTLASGNKLRAIDQRALDTIASYTDEDDRILMLGYKCMYYVEADRLCSCRIYYNTRQNNYPDGQEAAVELINENLPKLLIVENGEDPDDLFLNYDKYEIVDRDNGIWLREE